MVDRAAFLRRTAAVAGAVAGVGGFFAPARAPRMPDAAIDDGRRVRLPDDLPEQLRAHLDPDGDGLVPRIDAIVFGGHGRMRIGGRGPGLPVSFRTTHRVGHDMVADIALTWFGLPTVRAVDAFVDGHGSSGIAGRRTQGPEIDQAASLFLWSEAIHVPGVWRTRHGLRAWAAGPDRVGLALPRGTATDEAELVFRGDEPVRFVADRYKAVDGPRIRWSVDFLGWRRVDGINVPTGARVTWADEPGPWFEVSLEHAVVRADVDERLARSV